MIVLVLAIVTLLPMTALAEQASDSKAVQAQSTRVEPLTIGEVLARIELTHPLLRAMGAEREKARAKILKALGAWEPQFKSYTQVERYTTWNLTTAYDIPSQHTTGYNDSTIEIGHPWGFTIESGLRSGFGDAATNNRIAYPPDLLATYHTQHLYFAGSFHLLRGLVINEENAQFQQAELSGPKAEITVAQKRQDLYLAGAVQYWDWQVAVKQAEVVKQILAVAEARFAQVEGQARAGRIAPLDVAEAGQEVQRRRAAAIAAQRKMEYEQYKLSLFLWENGEPVTPRSEWAPEFQGETPLPTEEEISAYKVEAKEDRPEVRDLYIQAKMNNIDLKLAKNKLLPTLDLEGGPTKGGADWFVGIGYRVGLHSEIPLFQRKARGMIMAAEVGQSQ